MGFVNSHLMLGRDKIESMILASKRRELHPLAYEDARDLKDELTKRYAQARIIDTAVPACVCGQRASAVEKCEQEAVRIFVDRSTVNPEFAAELDRFLAQIGQGRKPQGHSMQMRDAGGTFSERIEGVTRRLG